ncbi:hypothetical protein [Sulfurimonas autotrophica]|uniref:Uncharacterized protein n=1 Tax=Sulfurimonas autotrophica (strain ATCC BAA-671 / DSM 16294 / JCM 11897 / OK10) TaxID=563040 RepID=E0UQ28_SULAO|nr:hypothetical protein [Sulfurimonas autotrophica]ADN08703.1 conserved hypothetical protein [Sulfurimonas autotrophica DSM 16294]
MKIENPFESGHIKNYILLYASVVVIMVLFFIATTLFNDVDKVEKKSFNTDVSTIKKLQTSEKNTPKKEKKFKLLDKAY